ncbi:hypothetical protein H9X90_02880 [Faecalicatena contorta]|uniref:hypothetical protein n=1 Tax=Faecalicatena contorta TaxID=39482 RepID=UPI0019606067|nr:hypothetical protein [Faecalicatena contorta]MBM6686808.1 hypothetical protein [Faecalicatena contorta]MBM6709705.1 hypothetical protein [Faecalicatena contorta]
MDIITGYLGEPHVTAEQDRDVNIGVVGDGSYVMPTGQRLAAEVQTNNEVRIRDGVLIHQGCAASIKKNTYDTVTITNGSQGMKRIDLIVARYQRNVETGVESLGLVALQGTPVESDPAVPVHTEGDIQAGDAVADMPLYEVEKDGLNITRVTKVFEEVENLSSLNGKMTGAFSASDIQSAVVSGVRGGWKRVGDIVFVDVKFNLTNSYKDAVIMKNLPIPKNDKAALAAVNLSANRIALGRIQANGDLEWHDTAQPATGNECSITGIYNCV